LQRTVRRCLWAILRPTSLTSSCRQAMAKACCCSMPPVASDSVCTMDVEGGFVVAETQDLVK
jgi:hypothetical protein